MNRTKIDQQCIRIQKSIIEAEEKEQIKKF